MISEFTVKVQLGVSPELAALLGAMLQVTTATAAVPAGAAAGQQTAAAEPPRVEVSAEQGQQKAQVKTEQQEPEQEAAPARKRRAAKQKESQLPPTAEPDEATPRVEEAEGTPGSKDAPGQLAGAEANTDDNADTGTDDNKGGDDNRQYTEEDIREAMHRTRQRIEGENYKTNTDGEAYQRYHRQLTGAFKNIAATLGAEKPSALPPDKRLDFIRQCDELSLSADGNLVTPLPF